MRDRERMDRILALIKDLWEFVPEWRFLQLIENFKSQYLKVRDGFYVEDEELEKQLLKILNKGE